MTDTPLTDEQTARAEALRQARSVLRGPGITGAIPDAVDVHSLAVFILDGGDPWELDEVKAAGPGVPKVRLNCAEHNSPSVGSHGFLATEGVEVTIEKREGAEPWCEVRHDGVTLFRGGDGSASRANERNAFELGRDYEKGQQLERHAATVNALNNRIENLLRERADLRQRNESGDERLRSWRNRALAAERVIAEVRNAAGGVS